MKLDLQNLSGKVAIIGAGPGDPELLTVRAYRLLEKAQVVLCDRLVGQELLAICPGARVIDVGKKPGGGRTSQQVIHHLLVKEARGGNFVVRLKGGDPFVFGRGGEEALFLNAHDVEFEVVPGISSSIAVPGAVGIPVTHRGVATHFSVVTAMGSDGPILETVHELGKVGGTLVVMMGVRQLPEIADTLIAAGRAPQTPAALVQQGTTIHEFVVEATLGTIAKCAAELGVKPPAVLIVGDVVALRSQIASGADLPIARYGSAG